MRVSFLDRLIRLSDPVAPLVVPRELHELSLRATDEGARLRLGVGLGVGLLAIVLYWACCV